MFNDYYQENKLSCLVSFRNEPITHMIFNQINVRQSEFKIVEKSRVDIEKIEKIEIIE